MYPASSRSSYLSRGCRCELLESRRLLSGVTSASIDFSDDGELTLPGYVADVGAPFTARPDGMTFGWDQDVSGKAKRRASDLAPDERYEDFIVARRATWEIEVPNGDYLVHVAAGDGTKGKRARVDVEGVATIDDRTTADTRWLEGTVIVSVSDGGLTVSPLEGFKRNRLAFLEFSPAPSAPFINWRATTTLAPQTRVEPAVAHIGTKMFVMGGYVDGFEVDNTMDIFDAATGAWEKGADFPGAQTHAGVTSDGERFIYKVAGQIGDGVPGTPTNEAWQFDTQTGGWTALPPLPVLRYAPGLAHVDGKLYLFGGTEGDRTTITDTMFVLDLANPAAGWTAGVAMPEGGDHLSVAVIDGSIYAIGGEHGHAAALPEGDSAYVQHSFLFRYTPATGIWERLADLPTGRSHAEGTTIVVNGEIVMVGGKLNATDVSNAVEVYDPATNTWAVSGPLPVNNQGGAAIFHAGRIYLSYGQDGAPTHEMWRTLWVGAPVWI